MPPITTHTALPLSFSVVRYLHTMKPFCVVRYLRTMKPLTTAIALLLACAQPALGATTARSTGQGQRPGSLPLVAITADTALNARSKVPAHMVVDGYNGPIGIKLRGNSSLSFNQKKYTLELRDSLGREAHAPLLGMPAHDKWVLLAPYNDVSMVRDPLAFQLWRDMGHWAPRTRMVELRLNGDYRGIYILAEAISRDSARVDISKLKKSDTEGRQLTGGYLLRIDTYNADDATFPSKVPGIGEGCMTSQVTWSCIYPKKKKLQPQQLDYIEQFVDSVELTIQSPHFTDPQWGYSRLIDVPSFVDYFIHTELSLNADGYKRSAYFYKEKLRADGTGGKLVAGPVWDYNLAYGNCNFCNANKPEAWCFEGGSTQPTPALWQRLLQDPAFRHAVKQRYQQLRLGALSDTAITNYIDRHAQLIAAAIDRHFERYPELLVTEEQKRQHAQQQATAATFPAMPMGDAFPPMPEGFTGFPPMPTGSEGFPPMPEGFGGFPAFGGFEGMDMIGWFAAYRVCSYDEEIATLKEWLINRLAFLDKQIARFDTDFEPHIQQPVEKKMPAFGGFPMP